MQYISESVSGHRVQRAGWLGITTTDGANEPAPTYGGTTSVQVSGAFGVDGMVTIEGSNDGKTYTTLSDPQGSPLNFRTSDIKQISEQVDRIRPVLEGGDSDTSVDVTLVIRRPA